MSPPCSHLYLRGDFGSLFPKSIPILESMNVIYSIFMDSYLFLSKSSSSTTRAMALLHPLLISHAWARMILWKCKCNKLTIFQYQLINLRIKTFLTGSIDHNLPLNLWHHPWRSNVPSYIRVFLYAVCMCFLLSLLIHYQNTQIHRNNL